MLKYSERAKRLKTLSQSKILVLDGAMGTAIQSHNLTAADFGGDEYEGCNENLVMTRPDVIQGIHEQYLKAGCDIVESNTFGSMPMVMAEYNLEHKAHEITVKAAQLARAACDKYSTPDKPRFVAGSIGPTTKALSVTGGTTFAILVDNFYQIAKGLIEGGADYLLIETAQDSRNIKASLLGIEKLEKETGEKYLVAVSGTIETMGTMLAGQNVEAFLASMLHRDLFYIGLNCATGPEFMTDHIRTLAKLSPFPVACVPNAGLPDEDGMYLETPDSMAKVLQQFIEEKWINFIGGCCGTNWTHIQRFAQLAKDYSPRVPESFQKSVLSGIEFLEITDEMRPVIVGERTNVIGSKKFKTLISDGKFEEAAEVARAQIRSGAHIIDVCLSNPDRVEFDDVKSFLEQAIKVVKAPLMIDSTDEKVIEMALTYCQGKAIINSINLEDGEERFDHVVPLAKSYGAALVVGTIDEDPENGMAVTRQRKLEIAERSYKILTEKWGLLPEDIYFDALVFPCGTGDEKYVGSAAETIEGLRLIKNRFPRCRTAIGVSNVSFGLPTAGREVLNSVFLHHCVNAGLDLAIVNSEKLERFASIPAEEIELADDLIFNRRPDAVARFTENFRVQKVKVQVDRASIPLDDRLSQAIVDGSKDGLIDDLNEALKQNRRPLDIVNGPLMKGMDTVGKLFNENKLIVAEVLQSAEVMKAAVSHLEQFMEKADTANRGKMLLATVKGDVHDIGKNLVDIILSNNGFLVINLGIKIPPEKIIEAAREHKPDMIGLSGLLVKSAQQMIITAEDLKRAGIDCPMLVGGAALSRNFTEKRILPAYNGPVLYASDAMNGLDLANAVVDPVKYKNVLLEMENKRQALALALANESKNTNTAAIKIEISTQRSAQLPRVSQIPKPPDFKRHVIKSAPLERIWQFINPLMLYTRHLGIKAKSAKMMIDAEKDKSILSLLKQEDPTAVDILEAVNEVKATYRNKGVFQPAAVYQFLPAFSKGNQIHVLSETGKPVGHWEFPRQTTGSQLCLSDYLNESDDNMAAFVVTAGHQVRETSADLRAKGEFLKSHIIQALAIETAEAYAEYLHSFLRGMWGFPDSPNITMLERFQAKYHGKRYSFGYPACPRLDDQKLLFDILRPEEIGVELTDGFMMDPEASVSAVVFHHPEASYYSVGNAADFNEAVV